MYLFASDKRICLRLQVSRENQLRMQPLADAAYAPLFAASDKQPCFVKFEYNAVTCSCSKQKRSFSYKEIERVEITESGLLVYLPDRRYVSIATEPIEKHNTALHDAVTLLKRRCRARIVTTAPIEYPETESDGRYVTDQTAAAQISYTLTDAELKRMLWYDYLLEEKMIVFLAATLAFWVIAAVVWDYWTAVIPVVMTVFSILLSKSFLDTVDGYWRNHQGDLQMMLYDELLVVRLRHTDLELEYTSMTFKRPLFGFWRLKCGDFFTLVLPRRVATDHAAFFDALYARIPKE